MKIIKNYWSFVKEAQEQSQSDGEEVTLRPREIGEGEILIPFGEGKSVLDPKTKEEYKNRLSEKIKTLQNFKELIDFLGKNGTKNLPKIFLIEAGTSHTGEGAINRTVAEGRLKTMRDILIEVLSKDYYLKQEQALSMIVDDQTYKPSSTDSRFLDTKKMPPKDSERYGRIIVNRFAIKGLPISTINSLASQLRKAKGYNINPDESAIVNAICSCQTFSDITDLDKNLQGDQGGLQEFINKTITINMLGVDNDARERQSIRNCLNRASRASGKGDIAQIAGDKITLDLKK